MFTVAFLLALSVAQPGPVPDVPGAIVAEAAPAIEDAPALTAVMVEAFKDGNLPLAFGSMALLLALLVGLINGFLLKATTVPDDVRKKILPWLVGAGGCLTAFGLSLIAGVGWFNAAFAGLLTSAAAVGLWELVIKTIIKALGKKKASP